MTNQEKAMEMFPDMPTLIPLCEGVREKLVEMGEWKDKQFRETMDSFVEFCESVANGTCANPADAARKLLETLISKNL